MFGKLIPQCSASLFLSALTSVTSSLYRQAFAPHNGCWEMPSLFIIPFITPSRSSACAHMSSWVKHYLVHWWANLNTACHVSHRPYAGEGRQGERVNHSSWGESVQEAAVALMFVCEGEGPTDPRWRMVWSRLWLMLQDSSALLVLPHSESLETAAHCLSSCVPLSCMLTISCFLEEEKRNHTVKDISIKRESSSLQYVMLNAPRQQTKNILWDPFIII